ncbi:MAG: hypothetical protein HYX90_01640 [Chloroflexi bacterium]|nr:hypothetical protein [Chloroflexota bacterium]
MKNSNRLLLFIGIALVLVAIVAAVAALSRTGQPVVTLPESEPAGVVQRYITALQNGDYEGSLKYVAPQPEPEVPPGLPKPVIRPFPRPPMRTASWRVTLGKTTIVGDRAQVEITAYVFRPAGPFGDPVQTIPQTFFLVNRGGSWLLENPEGLWWLY